MNNMTGAVVVALALVAAGASCYELRGLTYRKITFHEKIHAESDARGAHKIDIDRSITDGRDTTLPGTADSVESTGNADNSKTDATTRRALQDDGPADFDGFPLASTNHRRMFFFGIRPAQQTQSQLITDQNSVTDAQRPESIAKVADQTSAESENTDSATDVTPEGTGEETDDELTERQLAMQQMNILRALFGSTDINIGGGQSSDDTEASADGAASEAVSPVGTDLGRKLFYRTDADSGAADEDSEPEGAGAGVRHVRLLFIRRVPLAVASAGELGEDGEEDGAGELGEEDGAGEDGEEDGDGEDGEEDGAGEEDGEDGEGALNYRR